jgi:Pvc16 N-terminal domain
MADYTAVASVGASIEALLNRAFTDPQSPPPVPDAVTTAVLSRPNHAEPMGLLLPPALSVMLYRVAVSPGVRNSTPMPRSGGLGGTSISLNLHYLLTAWANDAIAEQRILARALQALEQTPMLSGPLLHESTPWGPDDTV